MILHRVIEQVFAPKLCPRGWWFGHITGKGHQRGSQVSVFQHIGKAEDSSRLGLPVYCDFHVLWFSLNNLKIPQISVSPKPNPWFSLLKTSFFLYSVVAQHGATTSAWFSLLSSPVYKPQVLPFNLNSRCVHPFLPIFTTPTALIQVPAISGLPK